MKNRDVKKYIFTFLIVSICLMSSFAQSNFESNEKIRLNNLLTAGEDEPILFSSFTSGLSALSNQNEGGASFDLSSTTIKYFIPFGVKEETVNIRREDGTLIPDRLRERFKHIHIYLINRAALNIDSLNTIANDYITSLQASPLTFRLAYESYLSKNKNLDEGSFLPVIKYRFSGDARAVPYNNTDGTVGFGGSFNLYLSLLVQLKAFQIDSEIKDKGTIYFEPSFGLAAGNQDLMETMFTNGESKILLSSELRMGFISDYNRIKDWGVLIRYTWEDIVGPNFRIGFNITPNN